MSRLTALQNFWESFGVPAYDENTVPQNAGYPRITYEGNLDFFDSTVMASASVWVKSTRWDWISEKAEEIGTAIVEGATASYDGGFLWVKPGQPFIQRMPDEDPDVRRVLINVVLEYT